MRNVINKERYDVCVVGLGYVGLTLSTALASLGLNILCVEKRPDVVDQTNRGKAHFSEKGLDELLQEQVRLGRITAKVNFEKNEICSVFIITVGTPLNERGKVRLDFIEAATRQVAEVMQDGSLVLLRSTVKIGTSRNVVNPILAQSNKKFEIAMCPERTLEGAAIEEIYSIPQVVGADKEETRVRAANFFLKLTPVIVQVSSLETAEMIKLVDNTYRDVRFAFSNEIAKICELFNINCIEVIEGGNMGYTRTNMALPGLVGGPCLEKDPHILWQSGSEYGVNLDITLAARKVNEGQPAETVKFIYEEYKRRRLSECPNITMLGLAFKGIPESDDLRGSMSLRVYTELRKYFPNTKIKLFDCIIENGVLKKLLPEAEVCDDYNSAIRGSHIVIIANNHPGYVSMGVVKILQSMAQNGFIYDYWNHFSNKRASEENSSYFGVGNIRKSRWTNKDMSLPEAVDSLAHT